MELEIKVKNGSTFTQFTEEQIAEIRNNFTACIPNCGRVVIFSETPPADTCFPWQQTTAGGAPLGKIKYYLEGVWA